MTSFSKLDSRSFIPRSPPLTPKAREELPTLRRPPLALDEGSKPKEADAGGGWAVTPIIIRPEVQNIQQEESLRVAKDLAPKLSRPDYYCKPSIEMLQTMSERELSLVDNLCIGRHGYGFITWSGITDVRQVDFDAIVTIDRGQCSILEDQGLYGRGNVLKKEAVVNLIVKHSRPSRSASLDPTAVSERLKQFCEKNNYTFLNWDGENFLFKAHL